MFIRRSQTLPKCPRLFFSTAAAESIMSHLQQNGASHLEKSLNTIKMNVDAVCVDEVLRRCSIGKQQIMGLRFFIWAGLQSQSKYRHTSYMYSKACGFLEIKHNPQIIKHVIAAYRAENSSTVSVKMFKLVLNLCREAKDAELGLWVLNEMKELGCRPDTASYNVVIRLFLESGRVEESMKLMREMGLIDLYPDMITFVCVIKGLCDAGRLEEACRLVKLMKGQGCTPNSVVYSALLDGICKFGSLERAVELLAEMEKEAGVTKPNVLTYTTLIQRFCENGQSMDGLRILGRMKDFGCRPNRITMSVLIKGLCEEGHMDEVYETIEKVVGDAGVLYDECYSSLVLSLWRIGKLEESEMVLRKMLAQGFRPDGAASSAVLRHFCLAGRLRDAFWLYEAVEMSGCVTIDSDLHSILLVGLCKEQYLQEAAKVAKLMVMKGVWVQAPYVEYVIKHLKSCGDEDLVSELSMVFR